MVRGNTCIPWYCCHLFDYRICRRMVLVSRRDKTVHASDLSKPWNISIALGRIHASGQENGRKDQ